MEFKNGLTGITRGTTTGLGVYLRINEHYTATVRDLKQLVNYLSKVGDTDSHFGIIDSEGGASEGFIRAIVNICRKFEDFKASKLVGQSVSLYRNQGWRDGVVVVANRHGFLVEYVMPKGTTALNILSKISDNIGHNISYDKARHHRDWAEGMAKAELIDNPQRGKGVEKRRK